MLLWDVFWPYWRMRTSSKKHLQASTYPSKNFSQILFKIRFTYIKLTLNFRKQCAANFILREFAAIQTSQDTYRERRKKQHFSYCYLIVTKTEEVYAIPLGKRINSKTASRKTFFWTQFSQKNCQIVTPRYGELWAAEVLLWNKGAVKQQ